MVGTLLGHTGDVNCVAWAHVSPGVPPVCVCVGGKHPNSVTGVPRTCPADVASQLPPGSRVLVSGAADTSLRVWLIIPASAGPHNSTAPTYQWQQLALLQVGYNVRYTVGP